MAESADKVAIVQHSDKLLVTIDNRELINP
jgi:hypothetical protein